MHPIRCQESVLDALFQAVGVERVAEVRISVLVVLPQWRGRHAQLEGRLEVFQDLAPVALVPRAAAVAFVHDDEVEEVPWELPVEPRPVLISRDCLVCGEVHLATLLRLTAFNLPACVPKRRENLVLRVVHQDIAIG